MQNLCRLSCGGRTLAYPALCNRELSRGDESRRHAEGHARVLTAEERERKGTESRAMVSESTRGRNLLLFQSRLCRTRETRRGSQDCGEKRKNLTRSPELPVRVSKGRQSPNTGETSRTRERTDKKGLQIPYTSIPGRKRGIGEERKERTIAKGKEKSDRCEKFTFKFSLRQKRRKKDTRTPKTTKLNLQRLENVNPGLKGKK
jgi:hypothetical protein